MKGSDTGRVVCLVVGIGLAAGAPALAQSVAGQTVSPGGTSDRRFDAGGSIRLPGGIALASDVDASWFDTYGGWFTVGQGKTRLRLDYLHYQERWEYHDFVALGERYSITTITQSFQSLQVAAAWYFRRDRRLTPEKSSPAGDPVTR